MYPDTLCREVCKGLIEQLEVDKAGQFLLAEVATDEKLDVQAWTKESLALADFGSSSLSTPQSNK